MRLIPPRIAEQTSIINSLRRKKAVAPALSRSWVVRSLPGRRLATEPMVSFIPTRIGLVSGATASKHILKR